MQNGEFLTPRQLAARWHMNISTLATWRSQGRGPGYVKVGAGNIRGRILYSRNLIENYDQARVVKVLDALITAGP